MTQKHESPRKRKATYARRKEECDALQSQVLQLQQRVASLQARTSGVVVQKHKLYEAVGLNISLKKAVEQQQLDVAAAQSLMSGRIRNELSSHTGMRIHLGRDWAGRRDTLLKMKDERLARALRHVTVRCQYLEPLKQHFSEEQFEDANGDLCCVRNEVIPFLGVQSMDEVFKALKFTMDTLEITISEQLGHLTIRDDYDTVDTTAFISNYRLVSALDSGVTTELNVVAFSQQIENREDSGGQPCSVISIDSVDQDDLHPHHPNKCVRKTINGSILLVPVRRKSMTCGVKAMDDEEGEIVIVMMRSFFAKTCRPQFDVSEEALRELQDNVTRWGDIVIQAVRRMIYA